MKNDGSIFASSGTCGPTRDLMTLMGDQFLTVVMATAANYETIGARMR